jgi:hypothetical protein
MNTSYEATEKLNMSNNERGFRAVISLGLIFAVLFGIVTAPAAVFGLSMVSVYLAMTTISGIDLSYDLVNWMSRSLSGSKAAAAPIRA